MAEKGEPLGVAFVEIRGDDAPLKESFDRAEKDARSRGPAFAAAGAKAGGEFSASFASAAASAATATTSINAGMAGIARGSIFASNKVQVLGQGLDDLQYVGEQGLRPIVGNLMQISPIAGIAAVALNLLWNNADKLAGLFGQGGTKTEADRMDELAAATGRTAAETEKLIEYKRKQKAIDDLLASRTVSQDKQERDVKAAVAEAGGGDLAKQLAAAREKEAGLQYSVGQREELDALKDMERGGAVGPAQAFRRAKADLGLDEKDDEYIRRRRAEIDREARDNAVRSEASGLDDAARDPAALERKIKDLEARGPAAAGLAAKLRGVTPRAKDAAAEDDLAIAEDRKENERRTGQTQARRKQADEAAKRKAEQAAEAAKRDDDRTVRGAAKDLQGRFDDGASRGKTITRDEVKGELERSGMSPQDAEKFAGLVFGLLVKEFEAKVGSTVRAKGVTREGALGVIAAEADERKQRETRHETPEQREARARREQDVSKGVGQLAPAYGDALQAVMRTNMRSGKSDADSDASLAAQLAERLRDVPEALRADVAKGIVEANREQFRADQAEGAANYRQFGDAGGLAAKMADAQTAKAETLGIRDLGLRVQGAVGDQDNARKQLRELERMNRNFDALIQESKRPRPARVS